MQILFCIIDKARKRSFTEVALNSVLEENAASAIDFEWEFYSPNKNIYKQCICCVSQLFHRRFNPGTLRIARSAVRTLRSVRKQTSAVFEFFHGMGVFDHTIKSRVSKIVPQLRTAIPIAICVLVQLCCSKRVQ